MTYTFVLAPDSFKESLTAKEVCQAMEEGIKRVFPDASIRHAPMADGGEGSTESVVDATGGKIIKHTVQGPLGQEVEGDIGLHGNGKSAFIEMASASGLHLVPSDKRNPLETSTYGTGQLIAKCLDLGINDIMIGIGGSATNDGGMGMAQALGYKFFDENNHELDGKGKNLSKVVKIDSSQVHPKLSQAKVTVACDVDNPLTGPKGAAHIFGPQKGADSQMIDQLDKGLAHFSNVISQELGIDILTTPGSGAAGGLGGGLMAFADAELKAGIDILIETTNLAEKFSGADFVLTGEGQINHQTKHGKTPYGVLKAAKKVNPDIKVIAIAGSVSGDIDDLRLLGFDAVFGTIAELLPLDDLFKVSPENIARVTENICKLLAF